MTFVKKNIGAILTRERLPPTNSPSHPNPRQGVRSSGSPLPPSRKKTKIKCHRKGPSRHSAKKQIFGHGEPGGHRPGTPQIVTSRSLSESRFLKNQRRRRRPKDSLVSVTGTVAVLSLPQMSGLYWGATLGLNCPQTPQKHTPGARLRGRLGLCCFCSFGLGH
jgi:hypothetical protein